MTTLLANWKLIAALGLAIVIGVLVFMWQDAKGDYRDEVQAHAVERANHAVTRQSVATLTGEITRQNEAIDAMAAEGARRAADARTALEAAQRQSEGNRALAASLADRARQMPASTGGEQCRTDPAILAGDL